MKASIGRVVIVMGHHSNGSSEHPAIITRARQADAAAASHEAFKAGELARVQVITREVERVVEKPVYRNVCLDADGLRLVGQAIGAAGHPGEPAPALPAADDAR